MTELLARDGAPTSPANPTPNNESSPSKRGVQRGAKIFLTGLVLFLPFLAIGIAENTPGPLVIPGTLTLAGLAWMLYSWIFGDKHPSAAKPVQAIAPPTPTLMYIPPPNPPIYGSPIEPPKSQSVIEHTTRSLEQQ